MANCSQKRTGGDRCCGKKGKLCWLRISGPQHRFNFGQAIHSKVIPNCQAPKRRSRPYTREIACEQRLGVSWGGGRSIFLRLVHVGSLFGKKKMWGKPRRDRRYLNYHVMYVFQGFTERMRSLLSLPGNRPTKT